MHQATRDERETDGLAKGHQQVDVF